MPSKRAATKCRSGWLGGQTLSRVDIGFNVVAAGTSPPPPPPPCPCLVVGPSLQRAELPSNNGGHYRGDFVGLGRLVVMSERLVPGVGPSGIYSKHGIYSSYYNYKVASYILTHAEQNGMACICIVPCIG